MFRPSNKQILLLFVTILGLLTITFSASLDSSLLSDISKLKDLKRELNGYGNNHAHKGWGRDWESFYDRIVDNMYADEKSIMREGPHPRKVSNIVGEQKPLTIEDEPSKLNMLWVLFGQFVEHDVSHIHDEWDDSRKKDISVTIPTPPEGVHEAFPVGSVLNMQTSVHQINCVDIKTQKINTTPFIDLSHIYAKNTDDNSFLRLKSSALNQRGKLKVTDTGSYDILPKKDGSFRSGDWRMFRNYILFAFHSLFHNFHNELCDQIISIDDGGSLNDDQVYEIAKNLNTAIFQHIVYDEYLPLLLGDNINQYAGYNNEEKPFTFNEFAAAVMRFGHSMLADTIKLISSEASGQILEQVITLDGLAGGKFEDNPDFLQIITRGALIRVAKKRSITIVDQMRNVNHGGHFTDVYSMDIQRGRDHGLPTYGVVAEELGLGAVNAFAGFTDDSTINGKLEELYGNPNQLDLIVGIFAEKPKANSILGKVGTHIAAKNFERARSSDRFWYERKPTDQNDLVFSDDLIAKIKEFSIRDVILASVPALADDFSGSGWKVE